MRGSNPQIRNQNPMLYHLTNPQQKSQDPFLYYCSTIELCLKIQTVGFEPTTNSLCNFAVRILYLGGQGEIRTHGPFRADSFQDCSNKPGSGTCPINAM